MCVHTDTCSHPSYKPCLVKASQHLICLFWPPLPQGLSAPIPGSPCRAGRTVPVPTGSACLDACANLPYPPRFQGSCYHISAFLSKMWCPCPWRKPSDPVQSYGHTGRDPRRESGEGEKATLCLYLCALWRMEQSTPPRHRPWSQGIICQMSWDFPWQKLKTVSHPWQRPFALPTPQAKSNPLRQPPPPYTPHLKSCNNLQKSAKIPGCRDLVHSPPLDVLKWSTRWWPHG